MSRMKWQGAPPCRTASPCGSQTPRRTGSNCRRCCAAQPAASLSRLVDPLIVQGGFCSSSQARIAMHLAVLHTSFSRCPFKRTDDSGCSHFPSQTGMSCWFHLMLCGCLIYAGLSCMLMVHAIQHTHSIPVMLQEMRRTAPVHLPVHAAEAVAFCKTNAALTSHMAIHAVAARMLQLDVIDVQCWAVWHEFWSQARASGKIVTASNDLSR